MSATNKYDNNVFTPGSRPKPSFATIILSIVSIAMIIGGFYLMGLAFEYDELTAIMFFAGGLMLDTIAFYLLFSFIPGREDAAIK